MSVPLIGEWRHNNGVLCCGTLRIAAESFDTNPAVEFRNKVMNWIAETLNEKVKQETAKPNICEHCGLPTVRCYCLGKIQREVMQ